MALAVSIAPLAAQADPAALDAFMKTMRAHDIASEEFAAKARTMPGGGLLLIRTVATRVQAIKTDGLPADLRAAFREYADCAQAVSDVFKDWPEKAEDVPAFVRGKLAENPNFLKDGEAKNASAMKALNASIANLDKVGKTHGLVGLGDLLQ